MSIHVRGFVSFLVIQLFVRVPAIQLIGLLCGSVQILFSFNPFTAKCGQRKISTKFPNYIFENFDKQIASCEITGRELSFEWSHHRVMSADSKVRVTLQNSIKHSGSERVKSATGRMPSFYYPTRIQKMNSGRRGKVTSSCK